LAVFRTLAGVGIGGEWSMGGTFIAEEWPEDRRKMGGGLMHTGYYFGFFLAAIANYFIGNRFGWRAMFWLGGVPALLIAFIYFGVHESVRWEKKLDVSLHDALPICSFSYLFSPEYRRRTILNSTYMLVSIIGLWAGSVYVPEAVVTLAREAGVSGAGSAQLASYATMILSVGTILGCILAPLLAESVGRRWTLSFYFLLMLVFILWGFGYIFYLPQGALFWFMFCLFFLGLGGGNFALYTIWVPEQYRTECRASAFAFSTSVGRYIGAGVTFLVGAGVKHFQTSARPWRSPPSLSPSASCWSPLARKPKAEPFPADRFLLRLIGKRGRKAPNVSSLPPAPNPRGVF